MKGKHIIEDITDYDEAIVERDAYIARGINAEVKLGNLVECHGISIETWELHIN